MKKILFLFVLIFGCKTYADDFEHFRKIIQQTKVRGALQFGLTPSTEFLLDSCNKVISVEFVTNGYGPAIMKQCLDHYRGYSNWIPIVFFTGYQGDINWAPYRYLGSESVYKAVSYQTATHKNYALIDDFYLTEINAFINNLLKCHRIDMAVVDGAFFLRGDLVQLLFDKLPLIIAVNTNTRAAGTQDDVYGLSRIVTPENYEEIYLPMEPGGITAWVIKNEKYKGVAQALKTLTP